MKLSLQISFTKLLPKETIHWEHFCSGITSEEASWFYSVALFLGVWGHFRWEDCSCPGHLLAVFGQSTEKRAENMAQHDAGPAMGAETVNCVAAWIPFCQSLWNGTAWLGWLCCRRQDLALLIMNWCKIVQYLEQRLLIITSQRDEVVSPLCAASKIFTDPAEYRWASSPLSKAICQSSLAIHISLVRTRRVAQHVSYSGLTSVLLSTECDLWFRMSLRFRAVLG